MSTENEHDLPGGKVNLPGYQPERPEYSMDPGIFQTIPVTGLI